MAEDVESFIGPLTTNPWTKSISPSSSPLNSVITTANSLPRRPNWADLTDDPDSSDDLIFGSSRSLKPEPFSSLSVRRHHVDDLAEAQTETGATSEIAANTEEDSYRSFASSSVEASPCNIGRNPMEAPPGNIHHRPQFPNRNKRPAYRQAKTSAQGRKPLPLDILAKALSSAEDARFWKEAAAADSTPSSLTAVSTQRTVTSDEATPSVSSTAPSSGSEHLPRRKRSPRWSAGAEAHAEGNCHPCIFYPKAVGCDSGTDCKFCHLDHEPKARHRRGQKKKAEALKQLSSDSEKAAAGAIVNGAINCTLQGSTLLTRRALQPCLENDQGLVCMDQLTLMTTPEPEWLRKERAAIQSAQGENSAPAQSSNNAFLMRSLRSWQLWPRTLDVSSGASRDREEPTSVLGSVLAPLFGMGSIREPAKAPHAGSASRAVTPEWWPDEVGWASQFSCGERKKALPFSVTPEHVVGQHAQYHQKGEIGAVVGN